MTTAIYNDGCPICSREVADYRRLAKRSGTDLRFDGLDARPRVRSTSSRSAGCMPASTHSS